MIINIYFRFVLSKKVKKTYYKSLFHLTLYNNFMKNIYNIYVFMYNTYI